MAQETDTVRAVKEELDEDPQVDASAVAVSADDGRVTLRGTVGSPRAKRAAGNAAARVFGVVSVSNELEVRPLTEHAREDAELRGDVLQALVLDELVPDTVDVAVAHAVVTLSGTVGWEYQREEAEFVAGNVTGVADVVDEIEVIHPAAPRATDVQAEIGRAFRRRAILDADQLRVTTEGGTVTLKGTVRSWAEHDDALAAAWSAQGVDAVRDEIRVEY